MSKTPNHPQVFACLYSSSIQVHNDPPLPGKGNSWYWEQFPAGTLLLQTTRHGDFCWSPGN